MSAAADQANFPTMIIPRGTEIRVNNQGQLSIRTPGNLVIQNSGNYSEIESTNGSIRIEENITVEAVSIRAGQACFIQGTLTAWKVHAKRITLEDKAKAFIMLQESEQLELARPDLSPQDGESLREVLYAIREHNIARIGSIYRAAFAEIRTPSDALRAAYESLDRFFATRPA